MHRARLDWARDDTQRLIEHKSSAEFQLKEEKQGEVEMRHFAGLGNQAERSDKGRAALSRFLESQRCSESFVEQVCKYCTYLQSTRHSGLPFAKCLRSQSSNSRGRFTRLSSISCFGTGPNIPCLSLHLLCLDAP
jgi:hypothetical protein